MNSPFPQISPILSNRILNFNKIMPRVLMLTLFSAVAVLIPASRIFSAQGHDGAVDPNFSASPVMMSDITQVNCVVPLPNGQSFVGGTFTYLSGGRTTNIGRINDDGSFDPSFVGQASGYVDGIFPLGDGSLFISGNITDYSGAPRNGIVKLFADGTLDTTFDPNVVHANLVAVQPDGKLIIVGGFTSVDGVPRNRIARLHPDGTLDPTFDPGLGTDTAQIKKAFVLEDGSIIIVGNFSSYDGVPRPSIAKLNSDGTLNSAYIPGQRGTHPELADAAFYSNGELYVGGESGGDRVVYRLHADGTLDQTFDPSGINQGLIRAILVQQDGGVVVGTDFDTLIRFNQDGSRDSSFQVAISGQVWELSPGQGGKIFIGGVFNLLNGVPSGGISRIGSSGNVDTGFAAFVGTAGMIRAFDILPNGKILIGGLFDAIGRARQRYVGLLNPDGSADSGFTPSSSIHGPVYAIERQPNGKFLLGGYSGFVFGSDSQYKGLWRINADGSLDTTLRTQIGNFESINTVALQSNGKILVGGAFTTINGVSSHRLARLNSDGSLDTSFVPEISELRVYKIAIQNDGKILVGGTLGYQGGSQNIVRLNEDGSVDPSFNVGAGANGTVSAIYLDPTGRIYVGGEFFAFNGFSLRYVARLNSNGSVDSSFRSPGVAAAVNSISGLPSGKILIGGKVFAAVDATPRVGVLRLLESGLVDYSFEVSALSNPSGSQEVLQIGALPDGKVLAVGQFESISGVSRNAIARFLPAPRITRPAFDFDSDGRADISVFRPSTGTWYRLNSNNNSFRAFSFGLSGDRIVPADFDGDYLADIAIFRPSEGTWYKLKTQGFIFETFHFGLPNDRPITGDFDGDGKADLAVYRPDAQGTFYVQRSTEGFMAVQFGLAGDQPTSGDYDGDGKADIGVYRPSTGVWYRFNSSNGAFWAAQFGAVGDKIVPADYTGDGKTDLAIYRPSTGFWYILRSENDAAYGAPFGISTDIPAAADYDGDGKADLAIFRPSVQGMFYILGSSAGFSVVPFGLAGDVPAPSAYVN